MHKLNVQVKHCEYKCTLLSEHQILVLFMDQLK